MKGIILFDNLNDLAFIDADDELTQHIHHLAFKDGLLEDLAFQDKNGGVNKDIVMQIFSPLIASFKVMQVQFGNKYRDIETEDGVMLLFSEILNYIALMICHKDELDDAKKELSLFNMCAELLYGPSLYMIKEKIPTCCPKVTRSGLLSVIMKKWRILRSEQQMFLVEAVERLIINQEITALCINLLQEILERIRSTDKEVTYSHTFLIVDTKLLALYSSRNAGQLPRETLLLLILLIHSLKSASHNQQDKEIDKHFDDEFFIPVSSDTSSTRKNEPLGYKSADSKSRKLKPGAQSLLIYLKSRSGILVPHILYVLEVARSINLAILCELSQYAVASSYLSSLCKSLHSLQNQSFHHHYMYSFGNLETNFRSLIDSVFKIKENTEKEKYIKKLISKWEQIKQCNVEPIYQKSQVTNLKLESAVSSMCELLKNVFEEVISTPCLKFEENSRTTEHQEIFLTLQKIGCRRLFDVSEFLEVRAMQNITMTSNYISEYPGLIHFIYVDRNSDCLIAPSVVLRKGLFSATSTLKNKVWNMVSVGRQYLDGVNKFCCLWKDDDLYFFYTIWFESSSGKVIKPTAYPNLKKFPDKGIICGNFYKKLVKECFPNASYDHIFCYEIFCVHLDLTSVETIIDHSRKLCAQLWDFTGAYRTSLDLL